MLGTIARSLALPGLLLLAWTGVARAGDWADNKEAARNPAFARSQAICRALKSVATPRGDAPDAVAAARLADCSSESLYYGIGRAADPTAARLCAFIEKRNADPQVEDFGFVGDNMLMTIYANGVGAPRNLDVATALACRGGFAEAEIDARVRHLDRLKTVTDAPPSFSLCDDITSGMMMGVCADHAQLITRADRARTLARLTSRWSPGERAALTVLQHAAAAFGDARGENEVDQSGTGRGAFVVAAEDKQDQAFRTLLDDLTVGKLAPATPSDASAADAALNARYQDLMRQAPATFKDTTVTGSGVAATERAWLRYRDAWLTFAKVKVPTLPLDGLATRLTRERTQQLGDVPASLE